MENQNVLHKIEIENRRKLSVTGVESVDGFTEQILNLTTGGIKLKILGDKIKITSFNKSNGQLLAEGDFTEIKYGAKKVGIKGIFK